MPKIKCPLCQEPSNRYELQFLNCKNGHWVPRTNFDIAVAIVMRNKGMDFHAFANMIDEQIKRRTK